MTRDPSRIDPILARLRAAWIARPDLRLGQLLTASVEMRPALDDGPDARGLRLFNAECHEFGAVGAQVEWPAPPAAQPPPVLDLDALAEAERAMTAGAWKFANNTTCGIIGPDDRDLKAWHWHKSGDGADRRGVVALRNAAPHLIAEARAAVALRQELAALRAHFDAAAPEHNLPALLDLYNDRTTEAREKLAEAKRLGLEAVRLSRDAIEAARMAPVDEPAATVIAIGCLSAADRIAAELEKL